MGTIEPGTIAILHDCCTYRAPAIILNPESDLICNARFSSISPDAITLHLLEEASHFLKASRFFISFSHNGNCCAFFATVLEYQTASHLSPPSVTFQLSSKIIGLEKRMSYRVAIGNKVVPLVRLFTPIGRILLPKPIDLSLTGIMVEFDEREDPELLPTVELNIELSLDTHVVQLKSVVKRRDGHRYGLYFPEVVSNHDVNAPDSLRKIIESLERTLLQERARLTSKVGSNLD
jgi:hypothetical protein